MLRPLDAVPETAPQHVRVENRWRVFRFQDSLCIMHRTRHTPFLTFITRSSSTPDTTMPATITTTRSKRLAGNHRLAALLRPCAAGGDVCADANSVGVGRIHAVRAMASGRSRVSDGSIGFAGEGPRRDAHVGITSFSADVSFGARPG